MKTLILTLFCIGCLQLSGCRVNRYYYVAEDPINLYKFSSFTGEPLLVAAPGDTVSATGTRGIILGGSVPVEYRGYRFYAPQARARFLRTIKVHAKRDALAPAVVYVSRLRSSGGGLANGTNAGLSLPSNYGYTPSTGATIHTGPRGGHYYINSHGNKTYVPRTGSSSPSRTSSGSYRSKSTGSSYRSRSSGRSYRGSGGRGRR
jgi:hypothetical protein